ncbi:MAG: PfkB family carbohydrate kinase [candidate division KSB1 bacterium]|nr:PfkB family carbohydrate kinase [candidate division KSB1 bacterium]MDZ7312927.1 PfkB family carbohydrate kinase [candidate division KSB1 bacterium]
MHKQFDIVSFGICSVDFLGIVAKYPEAGQKIPMEAFVKQGGGLAGTALCAAARLGAKTAYAGKFGYDEYSQFLLEEFQKEGVNIDHVVFADGAQPPIAFILVEKGTGERRITRYWRDFELPPEEIDRGLIQNSQILFLEHHFTTAGIMAAKLIKKTGGLVVVDAERHAAGLEQILPLADYLIVSASFAAHQTGNQDPKDAAHSLHEKYRGIVVVTAGEMGAFCQTSERTFYQPTFSVEVVDTTGAGDVFHGAFMVGLIENWPLPKILEFSAAVSALKCRGLGGRAMIPTRKEAFQFLQEMGTYEFWK